MSHFHTEMPPDGSEFMPTPSMLLTTVEEVRQACVDMDWMSWEYPKAYQVKPIPIIELIDEYVATGEFPYNTAIERMARERFDLPADNYQKQNPVSRLIYCANKYRDSDALIAKGMVPFTEQLVASLRKGQKLIAYGREYRVRIIGDKKYAMEPGKRKFALATQWQPVLLVA